ncbi:MAG: 5-formyltetrahydrofolate cyclo-ligase, partial [Eggerthellaceae bacterium]|nr:5-formyltetrahydrofolate cyclo-ligase [Eggerthellaceae bacterium]
MHATNAGNRENHSDKIQENRPNGAQGKTAARKAALRRRLRAERAALAPDERAAADARIAEQLFALPAWREARVVFAYLSFGSEVVTRRVIERAWAEGKTVALPRCASSLIASANPQTTADPVDRAAPNADPANRAKSDVPSTPNLANRAMT